MQWADLRVGGPSTGAVDRSKVGGFDDNNGQTSDNL